MSRRPADNKGWWRAALVSVAASCGLWGEPLRAESDLLAPGAAVVEAAVEAAGSSSSPVEMASDGKRAMASAPDEPQAASARPTALGPTTLWTFRAAAPVTGPAAVDSDGNVYIVTTEGYVHALSSEGQFRWSYTVTGMPIGAPLVDSDGHVFIATNAPRVYALRSDGHLHWVKRAPFPISTPPALRKGVLYFASRRGQLHALGTNGTWAWHRTVPGQVEHSPAPSRAGVLVATRTGPWLISARTKQALRGMPRLSGPAQRVSDTWLVEGDGLIQAFVDPLAKPLWKAEGRNAAVTGEAEASASPDAAAVVVEQEGELVWLSVSEGRPLGSVALPDRLSAPPLVLGTGLVVAPLSSGQVLVAHRSKSATALIAAGMAPPRTPTWDAGRERVVIVSGDGSALALSLGHWTRRGQ